MTSDLASLKAQLSSLTQIRFPTLMAACLFAISFQAGDAFAQIIRADIKIDGLVNQMPAEAQGTAEGDPATGIASSTVSGLDDDVVCALRSTESMVGWYFRSIASTGGQASNSRSISPIGGTPNLVQMTEGNFDYSSRTEYQSGEVLEQETQVRSSTDTAMEAKVQLSGEAPCFNASDEITILSYTEKWRQFSNSLLIIDVDREILVNQTTHKIMESIEIRPTEAEFAQAAGAHQFFEALDPIVTNAADLTFEQTSSIDVPEPASLSLFFIGILGIGLTMNQARR